MKLKKILLVIIALSASTAIYAGGDNNKCSNSVNIAGVKWYHISAEKRALYYQAFDVAAKKITDEVKKNHLKKDTWGIVLDIDETTLDNSWNEYDNYKHYKYSDKNFNDAANKEKSVATPGSKKFLDYIHKLGGYVSLVTNRTGSDKKVYKATIENLKKEKLYYDQVIFKNTTIKNGSDKNPRFNAVITGEYNKNMIYTNKIPAHKVIAYFGDNIQDFPKLTQKNMQNADAGAYEEFGEKYFILPNPMYGSWQ